MLKDVNAGDFKIPVKVQFEISDFDFIGIYHETVIFYFLTLRGSSFPNGQE